ncbi:DUF6768 family protein [Sphingomonas sp.]|uniref:DUF6768 family protein n=1 Tax=Sphingomonas sp. TaxID=28214 RepID=UPI001B2B1B50|nr:DUF6768 family protein [Sphingomonas sp.]MBO9713850.1 hypothetical protein [Sphingomonas sp.]
MSDASEQAFRETLRREPGLFTQLGAMFVGPIGRLTILVFALTIAAFVLGIWCLLHLLDAENARDTIRWFAATAACWSSVVAMKLWLWGRLHALAVLRALSRR